MVAKKGKLSKSEGSVKKKMSRETRENERLKLGHVGECDGKGDGLKRG